MVEHARPPHVFSDDVSGEIPDEGMPGYMEVFRKSSDGDPISMLTDRRRLKGPLKETVNLLHKEGKEVWAKYAAHKGFALTIISTAAFAAGMVGIGTRIRRKGERKK